VQFGVHPRFTPSQSPVARLRDKYALPSSPYILAVGTIQPRKNYSRLVAALGDLREGGLDVALVIAGGKGWLDTPIYESVRAAGLEAYVKFLGYVNDADLPALYSHAAAFAMPSLYEGFGLPILEAMACGTPVVTSRVSSLPEAAGEAALLVDPTDTGALADALRRVLSDSDLRHRLIERGLRHVAPFVWERTAEQLAAAFDYALKL
jgi:glycosyltransferase involved in cell wall biosynthesis